MRKQQTISRNGDLYVYQAFSDGDINCKRSQADEDSDQLEFSPRIRPCFFPSIGSQAVFMESLVDLRQAGPALLIVRLCVFILGHFSVSKLMIHPEPSPLFSSNIAEFECTVILNITGHIRPFPCSNLSLQPMPSLSPFMQLRCLRMKHGFD